MAEYPEHEKLREVKEKSQAIGEFIEWLDAEKGMFLASGYNNPPYEVIESCRYNIQDLLAEFFDIDRNALESEKMDMLEELRKDGR